MGWREEFGKLRSLMSQGELDSSRAYALRAWLMENTHAYPEQYVEQAIPYLHGLVDRQGVRVVLPVKGGVKELSHTVSIAPFAQIRMVVTEPMLEKLFHCEEARAIVALDLSQCAKYSIKVRPHHVRYIVDSEYLDNLRSLNLRECYLTPDALRFLETAPFLEHLEVLNLRGFREWHRSNRPDVPWLHQMKNLERLDLSYTGVLPWAGRRESSFPRLRELDLSHNDVSVSDFCEWEGGASLERLRLCEVGFKMGSIKKLAEACHLGGLTHLDLSLNKFGDTGAWFISRSTSFPSLKSLNVEACALGHRSAEHFATSPLVRGLRELKLRRGNKIDRESAFVLAQSEMLPEPLRAKWEEIAFL